MYNGLFSTTFNTEALLRVKAKIHYSGRGQPSSDPTSQAEMSTWKWSINRLCMRVCVDVDVCVCVDRLCLAHCWAVNRRWLWQEVGITILPMSLVFIFCLFRQHWLLQTRPGQILLHTQARTAAIHTQVYVCWICTHANSLCRRSVYSLKKEMKCVWGGVWAEDNLW